MYLQVNFRDDPLPSVSKYRIIVTDSFINFTELCKRQLVRLLRAPPKQNKIFCKVTKEKDQMIFSHMALYVIQGVKLKHF